MNPQLQDITLKRFEGTEITVGTNVYRLNTLVSEKREDEFAERRAVFYATREADDIDAVVKIRLQRDPVMMVPNERQDNIEWSKRIFRDEVRALRDLESIEELPTLLDNGVKVQESAHEYPGGYINCIAMSRVRGKPALDYWDLREWEGAHIKCEVTQILEEARLRDWHMLEGFPEKVFYERATGIVSLTCLAHYAEVPKERSGKFTERSGVVHGFGQNIWWT